MTTSPLLKNLLQTFSELYWLKPYDIPWDACTAYHVRKEIKPQDTILDLGCGDGLFSALMFGGRLPITYDRFCGAQSRQQRILHQQKGDIYRTPQLPPPLIRRPVRRINVGLELKPHHLAVARSLGIYDELVEGRFEKNSLPSDYFDKVFSVFAFYWADDLTLASKNVYRVLKKGGEFIVVVPSEHLYSMHLSARLSEENKSQKLISSFFQNLDGGRRRLTTRHARSPKEWIRYFHRFGLEYVKMTPVVNELMFMNQDIGLRPLLPHLIEHSNHKISAKQRKDLKTYLCKSFYPDYLKPFYQDIEGRKSYKHAYYLFHLRKDS